MNKVVKVMSFLFIAVVSFGLPNAGSMLGVSTYSATKIVDAIFLGMSSGTILALVLAGGGAIGLGLGLFKQIVKTIGKKAAIAW